MKNPVSFVCLCLVSVASYGQVKFINADGSDIGELCVAAVQSDADVDFIAKELGISPLLVDDVMCNGKPISEFVKSYAAETNASVQYIISVVDQKPETQLCLAALTSDENYEQVKQSLFTALEDPENSVTCNGMTVKQFARKYRERTHGIEIPSTAAL